MFQRLAASPEKLPLPDKQAYNRDKSRKLKRARQTIKRPAFTLRSRLYSRGSRVFVKQLESHAMLAEHTFEADSLYGAPVPPCV